MSVINEITVGNTTYDVQDLISRPILTYAQYKALEDAHLTDPNVDYHISDLGATSAPIDDNDVSTEKLWSSKKTSESQAIHSTTEQVVGTWINGKPIYQKTFTGTTPSSGSTYPTVGTVVSYSIGANVEYAISLYGYVMGSSGACIPLNVPLSSTQYVTSWVRTNDYTSDPNAVAVACGSGLTSRPFAVTIRYTKTTDTASS